MKSMVRYLDASFMVNRCDHGTRLAKSEPGPVQLNSASITFLNAYERVTHKNLVTTNL